METTECSECGNILDWQEACSIFNSEAVNLVQVCLNKECENYDEIVEEVYE